MRIDSSATIRQAMQAISLGCYGAAVVFDSENPAIFQRILTDGDIRRALLSGHGLEAPVSFISSGPQVLMKPEHSAEEVSLVFNQRVRLVPIVDEDSRLIDLWFHDKRVDIAVASPLFDDDEIALVNECMISGWVSSGGPFVTQFEDMVAKQIGIQNAISCSSGTTALHLVLMGYGIGPGDEVIVPSLTFISTANAVTYTGAKAVFVDSDPKTWNIDPMKIEAEITERTRAIIPVHLYGLPAEMDLINSIAARNGLIVIEDAAEAQGAKYKDRPAGMLGDAAIFSFFGNKVITTGEGGMVLTNNGDLADRCRLLRDHGMSKERRYWHEVIGYNYRMTNIQAALGVAQMKKFDRIICRKKEIANLYNVHLQDIKGISLPPEIDQLENVYWLYTVLIDKNLTGGCGVSDLMIALNDAGVDCRKIFLPIHQQPVYSHGLKLPVAEMISSRGISLPSSPQIRDDQIESICGIIKHRLDPANG
ncbi:aminotransferase class I/II-fold pyridoxal phosphate-dependent enzyme [Litorivicinus sp.]|nr:aminotransferase class I/II-fold pyridoxal phosphate-dependent enzyme [Litorivicinus sp.]